MRGDEGYRDQQGRESLNVLTFQKKLRSCPKPTIAMVSGYAIGGGHVLHVLCDMTIAADNSIFGQVGPKVGSFDGGIWSELSCAYCRAKKKRVKSGSCVNNILLKRLKRWDWLILSSPTKSFYLQQ